MNRNQGIILFLVLCTLALAKFLPDPLDQNDSTAVTSSENSRSKKVKDGAYKQYTADNRLKTVVNYKNGIKHGTSYLYHTDGKTILLEMPYVEGKREGMSRKYYESGKTYATTSYKKDLLHGERRTYYSNGKLKSKTFYAYGYPGVGTKEYFIDGSKKTTNKIVFIKKGNRYFPETKEACEGIRFYIGKLIEDQFYYLMDKNLKALPVIDGKYYIDPEVYTPSYLKYQDIVCYCESSQGNPIILKKKLILD